GAPARRARPARRRRPGDRRACPRDRFGPRVARRAPPRRRLPARALPDDPRAAPRARDRPDHGPRPGRSRAALPLGRRRDRPRRTLEPRGAVRGRGGRVHGRARCEPPRLQRPARWARGRAPGGARGRGAGHGGRARGTRAGRAARTRGSRRGGRALAHPAPRLGRAGSRARRGRPERCGRRARGRPDRRAREPAHPRRAAGRRVGDHERAPGRDRAHRGRARARGESRRPPAYRLPRPVRAVAAPHRAPPRPRGRARPHRRPSAHAPGACTMTEPLRPLDPVWLERTVRTALDEDLGPAPGRDVTTQATVPPEALGVAHLVARAPGVVAGLDVVPEVLAQTAERLGVAAPGLERLADDGDRVAPGDVLAVLDGPVQVLLVAERTLLNLGCRASGVATHTRRFADLLVGTDAKVLDTRKPTPGMRELDKHAVRAGGRTNKRMGLFDVAMVKDNHVVAAGSVTAAIEAVRSRFPDVAIQVEADTFDQAVEA